MNLFIIINIYILSVSGFFLLSIFILEKLIEKYENRKEITDNDDDDDDDDDDYKNLDKKETPYEDKYKEQFSKLQLPDAFFEASPDKLESLSKCILFENTPLGNVVMFYKFYKDSPDASAFIYYSDHNIPFRILEIISQKYCIMFKCKSIYIDMNEELKKYENHQLLVSSQSLEKNDKFENIKKPDLEEKQPITQKNNVFANFKSYNKIENSKNEFIVNNTNVVSSVKQNVKQTDNIAKLINNAVVNKSKITSEENNKICLKDRTNRYTYLGKISNFSFLQTPIKKEVIIKNITYRDYKNIKI